MIGNRYYYIPELTITLVFSYPSESKDKRIKDMTNELNSPVQIEIGSTGITAVVRGGSVKPALQVDHNDSAASLAKTEQPPALESTVPTYLDQTKSIRELTTKAVMCAMEKLNVLLSTVQPTAEQLTQYMELTLKLLDAKEAFEWADAFRAAIMKNPKLMAPNGRGLSGKSLQTRTNATIAQRLDRGDTRTTPKRLIASMPQDDDSPEQEKAAS